MRVLTSFPSMFSFPRSHWSCKQRSQKDFVARPAGSLRGAVACASSLVVTCVPGMSVAMSWPAGDGKWDRAAAERLIELYEQHPCLYATSSPEYLVKEKRNKALRTIAQEISSMRPNTSVKDLKKKINILRTQYLQEKKKQLSLSETAGEEYTPTLWCYRRLQFLEPHSNFKPRGHNSLPQQQVAFVEVAVSPSNCYISDESSPPHHTSSDESPSSTHEMSSSSVQGKGSLSLLHHSNSSGPIHTSAYLMSHSASESMRSKALHHSNSVSTDSGASLHTPNLSPATETASLTVNASHHHMPASSKTVPSSVTLLPITTPPTTASDHNKKRKLEMLDGPDVTAFLNEATKVLQLDKPQSQEEAFGVFVSRTLQQITDKKKKLRTIAKLTNVLIAEASDDI